MIILLRKKTLIFTGIVCLIGLILLGNSLFPTAVSTFSTTEGENLVVIIDPGHGGEDGGAVSADGQAESHINLAIAHNLNDLLQLFGFETTMTRYEDVAIYSDGAQTLREKKTSDLKNRVALVNSFEHATLISIHQNSLPSVTSVHGAQVFYAPTEGSDQMAETIQLMLNSEINPGNEKSKKAIDPSVYLMKNVTCRAVLIECGFMSNHNEVAQLQQKEYQKKLAITIASGFFIAEENSRSTEGNIT